MPAPSNKRMRLDKKEAQVVIVGGGLAGLSVALALERAGFNRISLFERDDNFDAQKEGYGLTITYNPKGPLAALGILEQIAQRDCPSRSHYLFRSDGTILGYFGNSFSKRRGVGQRGNLRVPRKVLRRILMDQLKITKIHWCHRLLDYNFDSDQCRYRLDFLESKKGENASEIPTTVTVVADLLVAADGIRSAVLSKLYRMYSTTCQSGESNDDAGHCDSTTESPRLEQSPISPAPIIPSDVGLRYMGVRLILGIAEFTHPLLHERGFYTLDGKHRLFTMPYSSNRFSKDKEKNRIMWQLSVGFDKDVDQSGLPLDAISLRNYVVQTCRSWHSPVLDMVEATPIVSIWGTDLMDRDPQQVYAMILDNNVRRLAVVGDALHSMSPFKGQGANQALADGPLLAHWLQKSSIDSALKGFWREAVQRTAPVVAASRLAAKELHSPSILQHHGFAGVRDDAVEEFLTVLRERKIGTSLGAELDAKVLQVIKECNVGAAEPPVVIDAKEQQKALKYASCGDTHSLRLQSLAKHAESIRTVVDEDGRSCLHLAALGGHATTCQWLLTELGCDPHAKDMLDRTPVDYATEQDVAFVLKQFCNANEE